MSVVFMDKIGLKVLMLGGFSLMGSFYVLLLVMPSKSLFSLGIYALTFFFANFGPNCAIFCLARCVVCVHSSIFLVFVIFTPTGLFHSSYMSPQYLD